MKNFFGILIAFILAMYVGAAGLLWLLDGRGQAVMDVYNLTPQPEFVQPVQIQPTQPVQPYAPVATATPWQVQDLVTVEPGPTLDIWATSTAFAVEQNTMSQPPKTIITLDDLANPTRDYSNISDDQLAACLHAQQVGQRLAPYCPPNPAEFAGPGR